MHEPDFYMSSRDQIGGWEQVRQGWRGKRLSGPNGAEYLCVTVDPPTPADLGNVPSTSIVISPHSAGTSLFPVSTWPLPVYVYRILRAEAVESGTIASADVTMVAWCEIYESLAGAETTAKRPHISNDLIRKLIRTRKPLWRRLIEVFHGRR